VEVPEIVAAVMNRRGHMRRFAAFFLKKAAVRVVESSTVLLNSIYFLSKPERAPVVVFLLLDKS
jgi:hypothetical protein